MVKKILVAAWCFSLLACSQGLNYPLGRTTDDPFPEIPTVRSFNGDYSIKISWTRDEAADMYRLYRKEDDIFQQYQVVYEGRLTTFTDTSFTLLDEGKIYLYRLGKKRGEKWFVDLTTDGKTALGVATVNCPDSQEPNNEMEDATPLDIVVFSANCYFYSSNNQDSVSIFDVDWYYVDLPPHWRAEITLDDIDFINASLNNHFMIYSSGFGSVEFASGGIKFIENTTNSYDRFFFSIFPRKETFFSDHSFPSGGCGAFINYKIKVLAYVPM